MRIRRTITCICCKRTGTHKGRNLVWACYERHKRAGTLHRFPRSVHPAKPWIPTSRHGRRMLDRYRALAAIRPPLSTQRIAFELGVSDRQVERYAAATRTNQTRTEAAA
jgi:hypothetical protein